MLPELLEDPHEKVVSLSTLRTGGLYPLPGNIPGTHFSYRLNRLQGRSAAGRIISSMKNYNDHIGKRTRELSACSA